MNVTTHICSGKPTYGLKVTATRYVPSPELNPRGPILVLAHAYGSHKETWGPVIRHLFRLASEGAGPAIAEAWSIECPNHGQSAVINGPDIDRVWGADWDGWEYPRAMLAFINSRPAGVDFYERELIAVGHSHGGNSLVLLHDMQPRLEFSSFILLDPTLGRESPAKDRMQRILTTLTWCKKDVWPNRKAASKYLSSQPGLRNWDPEVFKLYIEHGICDHFAAKYPDPWKFKGVTLACNKNYETACYRADSHHPHAWGVLHRLYRCGPPIHLILSLEDEFGGAILKEEQMAGDPGSSAKPASVQRIAKGGHMFVQSNPVPTAYAIWNALSYRKDGPVLEDPNEAARQFQANGLKAKL
ncbi:Alpha/beta hydrolase family-domain-containing protein [Mycena galopus ATCC 62051]|nr:Alpha/beta hydrolase family-domain-containing protein [Mycena galopus ATCC 62051]